MIHKPSKLRRARKFGFRARNATHSGRKVLAARRAKGRRKLSLLFSSLTGWASMSVLSHSVFVRHTIFSSRVRRGRLSCKAFVFQLRIGLGSQKSPHLG